MPPILLSLLLATVSPARAGSPIDPTQLVGSWNVTLSSNYSTCDQVKRGDVTAQQWVISVASGKLAVQVLGAGSTSPSYSGFVKENLVGLVAKNSTSVATVELEGDIASLRGRRVVANVGPCAIIYDVEAKRQQ